MQTVDLGGIMKNAVIFFISIFTLHTSIFTPHTWAQEPESMGFFLGESNAFDLLLENSQNSERLRFQILSSNSGFLDLVPGIHSMKPVVGDFDGDGYDSVGIYDKERNVFLLKNTNSEGLPDFQIFFGQGADIPIVGDFNGDGKDTVGVYNSARAEFRIKDGPTFEFGPPGSTPVVGDFDGDGLDTVGVLGVLRTTFYLKNSLSGGPADITFNMGYIGWRPVVGDFSGDGIDTIGRFNSTTGMLQYKTQNLQEAPVLELDFGSDVNYTRYPLIGRWENESYEEETGYPWPVSSPEEEGFDPDFLEVVYDFAENEPTLEHLRSLLVIKNGKLVKERYFHGNSAHFSHNLRSVTKSVSSILVGIAMSENKIGDTGDLISEYYPEYFLDQEDPRHQNITLDHLLTMSAGFGGDYQINYFPWWLSGDLIKFTLTQPLEFDPRSQFKYTDGISHVLGNLVARTSEQLLPVYAQDRLFVPLGIKPTRWDQYNGQFLGFTSINMRPRDMARLGYLYLRKGNIDGHQIVPESWVEESIKPRIFAFPAAGGDQFYGYQWWVKQFGGYDCFYAWGYGGQMIFNFPELDLIVVATSKSDKIILTVDEVSARIKFILEEGILQSLL